VSSMPAMARLEQPMRLLTATGLKRWVKSAEAKTLHAGRLNIGPRLVLGFVFIILSMLAADAVVLWQFHLVRAQAERLNGIDQTLVAVLRLHTSLTTFHDRLEDLADSQDIGRLVTEGERLRTAVLEDSRGAMSAFSLAPFDFQRDPTILPILHAVQSALPAQLEAITTLANAGDWRAVRQRLANQLTAMQSVTLALVERVDHEVGEEQAQTVRKIKRVQRLVFLVVPLTAVFTLLIAGTFGLAITRSITQPLARLVEGSKALARGDFQHKVSVTGRDELADLGRVFNDTARRLQDLYATLQQSEAFLAEAQRLSKTGSFGWNVSTGEIRWSEETFRIFQYDRTAKPTVELILQRVHPEDAIYVKQTIESASMNGEGVEHEYRLLMPDNTIKYVHVVAHNLSDKAGKIVLGAVMDVTERKRAEEALHEAQANLARVSRVTTMGELTASLAHEIRQPIAAAVTNARTCLRWLGRDQPDVAEAREAASRIVNDVTRAADIIGSISLLFKKGALQRELVDVNELIREMIVLLRSEANRYSISIRTDLAEDLPKLMADRVQLQQVFMNLMLNGIDAMKATGHAGELTIKSEVGDAQLLISVSDTGVGLPPEQADQIFRAFFTTKDNGTGMGLPISRSIIESHGGRLWAAGASGRGATFHFTLPATVAAHA
jgi:signal transduction histidine kinase/HAMP domain-containing protein